jgi:hypothetical protein
VSCCCENLADEAGDISESRGRGTSAVGSRYRATTSQDVTVDTSVCLTAICTVLSRAVSKSPINSIINPNPRLQSHSFAWQYFNMKIMLRTFPIAADICVLVSQNLLPLHQNRLCCHCNYVFGIKTSTAENYKHFNHPVYRTKPTYTRGQKIVHNAGFLTESRYSFGAVMSSRHIFMTQGCAINTKAANKSYCWDNTSKNVTIIYTPSPHSWRWLWRLWSSGMWHRVVWYPSFGGTCCLNLLGSVPENGAWNWKSVAANFKTIIGFHLGTVKWCTPYLEMMHAVPLTIARKLVQIWI